MWMLLLPLDDVDDDDAVAIVNWKERKYMHLVYSLLYTFIELRQCQSESKSHWIIIVGLCGGMATTMAMIKMMHAAAAEVGRWCAVVCVCLSFNGVSDSLMENGMSLCIFLMSDHITLEWWYENYYTYAYIIT